MYIKLQKKTITCAVILLSLLLAIAALSANTHINAQAQDFEQHFPTYSLFCEDEGIIKNGSVKFDLTDPDLWSNYKGMLQCEYQVSATNGQAEFAIPFLSNAYNIPQLEVKVNNQVVNGLYWYGDETIIIENDYDDSKTYSPALDETVAGTLYTIVPDTDTMTIELTFAQGVSKCYIYQSTHNQWSSHSADGKNTWTMNNVRESEYMFFVIGDVEEHTFNSSCEYRSETITCKDFIDSNYEIWKEYYEEYENGVPVAYIYSLVNRALQKNLSIEYDRLFYDSLNSIRLNAYKFSIELDADSIISYELPVRIQGNYAFKPAIYTVEHAQLGNYKTNYTIELNSEVPYIIESSVKTNRTGSSYTAEASDDFYFVCCASEKPVNTLAPKQEKGIDKTILIVCIVLGCILFIGLVTLIAYLIYRRKV